MRYQRCHPIHSSYPLRDEQVLTGRRVTIKYIVGEQPGRPTEDSWIEPPTKEDRMHNKMEGRWNGYTFFELHSPAHGAEAASYYVGTRPVGEWAKQEHTLPPRDMRTDEAVQLRNQRMQEPVGAWMATERSTRSSASTDGPQSLSGRRLVLQQAHQQATTWRKDQDNRTDRKTSSAYATYGEMVWNPRGPEIGASSVDRFGKELGQTTWVGTHLLGSGWQSYVASERHHATGRSAGTTSRSRSSSTAADLGGWPHGQWHSALHCDGSG